MKEKDNILRNCKNCECFSVTDFWLTKGIEYRECPKYPKPLQQSSTLSQRQCHPLCWPSGSPEWQEGAQNKVSGYLNCSSTLSGNSRIVSWMSARIAASSTSALVASMLPYLMLYLGDHNTIYHSWLKRFSLTWLCHWRARYLVARLPFSVSDLTGWSFSRLLPQTWPFPFSHQTFSAAALPPWSFHSQSWNALLVCHFVKFKAHLPTRAVVVPGSILNDTFLEKQIDALTFILHSFSNLLENWLAMCVVEVAI